MKKNTIKGSYIIFLLAFLYAVVMIWRCAYSPINSDMANMVLEANDILHGNVFLSDWILTKVTFITTDHLYFILGSIFGGISNLTYYIAHGLMIAVMIMLGFLLCDPGQNSWNENAFYLLMCMLPSSFAIKVFSVHSGAIIWVFLCLMFASKEFQQHDNKNLTIIAVALTLGCLGDAITLVLGAMPLLLFCLTGILSKKCDVENSKIYKKVIVFTIVSVAFSFILDRTYIFIGGADRNGFISLSVSFEPLENLGNKFALYIQSIFLLGNASFFGSGMKKAPIYLIHVLIIILGFILVIRNVRNFFFGRDKDAISTLLSLGIVAISLIYILTTVSVDITSARYIAYIFTAFCILIVRNWAWLTDCTRLTPKTVSTVLILMAVVSLGARLPKTIMDIYHNKGFPAPQEELGTFLKHQGLREGYGSFWNASVVTVSSKNQVKVRAILENQTKQEPFKWFCKKSWYREPSNFVVTMDDDMFGVTPENVVAHFGTPRDIIEFEEWKILVYDRDISPLL